MRRPRVGSHPVCVFVLFVCFVIEYGITHCFERIEPPLNAASNDTLVVGQLLKWLISDNTVNVLYALVCFPFPGDSENFEGDGLPYHLDAVLEQTLIQTVQNECGWPPEHVPKRQFDASSAATIP